MVTARTGNPKKKSGKNSAPSVLEASSAARRLLEAAALLDAIEVASRQMFLSDDRHPAPYVIVDEVGSRRDASLDALTELGATLARLSSEYRARARTLHGARLGVELDAAPPGEAVQEPQYRVERREDEVLVTPS